MKYFSLVALACTLLIASCGGDKSSTSAHMAKVLDTRTASDIHALLDEMSMEVSRNDSRLPEVIHAINQVYLNASADDREALNELSNAQMVMLQEKMHFDSERSQMPDKILTAAAEAVSKEELMNNVTVLIRDLKASATRYQDAYLQMLMVAQSTEADNPILSEILNEVGGNAPKEGEGVTPPAPAAE